VLKWAGSAGFDAVEIPCPPFSRGKTWHRGGALDLGALDGPGRDALGAALEASGVEAAALAWYGNVLDPDAERAQAAIAHLGRVVETAATLGVPVVCLAVGRDPSAGLGDSIAEFARRVGPLAEQAEASGVRLAIENDPMCGLLVEDMPGNAAFCPELWEKLFTHLRSDAVGLALDPSHLVWLGVDPIAAATDYAEKIFHFQAKDAEVFDARRQDCSVLRPSGGWWRYRLPGLGEIDWRRMLDRLQEVGYGGAVVVEHADPVWQGSAERVKAGLVLARRHLAQFLP
jgi:sugar phosphate isomerase/epimerase